MVTREDARRCNGYPAVPVRLSAIDLDLLTDVFSAAWRSRAPRRVIGD